MTTRLRIEEPMKMPREVTIDGPVLVGRESVDVTLDDPSVSRQHLRLTPISGGVRFEDLGSRSGTILRGQQSREGQLRVGDSLVVGGSHIVVLAQPGMAPPTAAVPPDLVAAARRAIADGPTSPPQPASEQRWCPNGHVAPVGPSPGPYCAVCGQPYLSGGTAGPTQPQWVQPQQGPGPLPNRPASAGLALAVQILAWGWGGLAAISGLLYFAAGSAFQDFMDAPARSDTDELIAWADTEALADALYVIAFFTGIAVLVVLIVFLFQVHKAQDRFGLVERRWTRGWTIGAWFIPLANLVIPALVVNDVESIATAHRQRPPAPKRVWAGTVWWWLVTVAGSITFSIGSAVLGSGFGFNGRILDESSISSGYSLMGFGALGVGASGALTAFVAKRISAADQAAG